MKSFLFYQTNLFYLILSESPRTIKAEPLSVSNYNYMESNHFNESESSSPIDLSRRRDSVETRKTPSPYNSSTFGGSSPSILNDSPTTTTHQSNHSSSSSNRIRSDTPIHHYQNGNFIQNYRQTTSPTYQTMCDYQNKSRSSPQSDDLPMHRGHHQEYPADSSMAQSAEEINPYFLHAVALQQKFVQSQMIDRTEANELTKNLSLPVRMNHSAAAPTYPMVIGRDGKLARPFKAYPRDPLSISATFTASDSILDRASNEKFNTFRKQMLDQIHAANGGQPTISNPKMRRSAAKSFSSLTTSDEEQPEQIQHPQPAASQISTNSNHSDSSTGGGNTNNNNNHKDTAYYERRKKNNAAAKKSRDRRRIKEDEIAIRAAFLERENIELKIELAATKRQLSKYIVT